MDFQTTRQTVQRVAESIKPDLIGENRWSFINDLLEDQTDEIKLALKNHFDAFLSRMKQLDASDIDLGGPGCRNQVWFRTYGNKQADTTSGEYNIDETDVLILNILTESERQQLFKKRNLEISYRIFDKPREAWTRFRASVYFDLTHLAVNMRRVNDTIIPFTQLGFDEEVAKALSLKYQKSGLILITGITGSGKSTTLDSIIDANNRTMESHIIIIADPIEYVHQPIKSIVKHREVGRDVHSFKEGTVQALRQDPDIIMIGEMRDADTITTVLEVVDSGHKVFSTLHTSSAVESIDRILGEIPLNEQNRIRIRLADVLSCVISQKLIPSLDGKRALAKEVMIANSSVRTAIRNNNVGEIYQIIHQSSEQGMNTMEQDLARLYAENKISYFEAYINANNKKRLEELIKYNY
ncbi:twitching motility protein PilT [candidate division KSB1 bacterium]|nr:twitching motility protein PilT [candidate division KSB1 bacterium]